MCLCVPLTFVRVGGGGGGGGVVGNEGLNCVEDSCFPGQGVIAVAFSGIMCAHIVVADIGNLPLSSVLKK